MILEIEGKNAWQNYDTAVRGGVEMLLNPHALKSHNRIKKIHSRMMCVLFIRNPCTTIVSCYRSTDTSYEMDIITFYNDRPSLVRHIPKHNVLIIGGDRDTHKGKEENNKFCLHNFQTVMGNIKHTFHWKRE